MPLGAAWIVHESASFSQLLLVIPVLILLSAAVVLLKGLWVALLALPLVVIGVAKQGSTALACLGQRLAVNSGGHAGVQFSVKCCCWHYRFFLVFISRESGTVTREGQFSRGSQTIVVRSSSSLVVSRTSLQIPVPGSRQRSPGLMSIAFFIISPRLLS